MSKPNPKWFIWIRSSFDALFSSAFSPAVEWYEGTAKPKSTGLLISIEVVKPDIELVSCDTYNLTFTVRLVLQVARDKEAYQVDDKIGQIQNWLRLPKCTSKIGDLADVPPFPLPFFAWARLSSPIEVAEFGLQPDSGLEVTMVEADFTIESIRGI